MIYKICPNVLGIYKQNISYCKNTTLLQYYILKTLWIYSHNITTLLSEHYKFIIVAVELHSQNMTLFSY